MKRYNPKKIDVRMTTTVVAYTSFCVGHVTRLSSLRTSLRNRRACSMRPPAASFTVSSVVVLLTAIFITLFLGLEPRLSASRTFRQAHLHSPAELTLSLGSDGPVGSGRPGGNR